MQNEFDDHIKKQVAGFKLPPSPQIWDLVEAQLPEKKRRRAIFWWLPLSVVLIGFGIYELADNHHKENKLIAEKTIVQTNTFIKKDSLNNLISVKKIKDNQNKKDSLNNLTITKNANYPNKKDIVFLKNNISTELNRNEKKNKKDDIILSIENQLHFSKNDLNKKTVFGNNNLPTEKKSEKDEISIKGIEKNIDQKPIANTKPVDGIINKIVDTASDNLTQKQFKLNKKDTAKFKKPVIKIKVNPLGTKWELMAEIGRSNTVGKAFSSNSNAAFYDLSNAVTASPGNNPNAGNLYSPTAGISFGVGLQRTKKITKQLAWFGGLGYRYASNHQVSGAFVDSSILIGGDSAVFLSTNNKTDKVPNYYKYGNSLNHSNYTHILNLSVGLKYNTSNRFSIYGGAMLGYQFSSHWLQPDLQKSILYYSDKLTNKWNIGSKIGFDWQFIRSFSVGAFYRYNFNKASAASVQQNMHWQTVGVNLSIQLPTKK